MFWECHIETSSIDKLLDQSPESIKLQNFFNEDELIQECLTQNKRLLDYLVQQDIMKELIGYMIKRPKDDDFRNAQVASELLSGDFPRIQEKLLEKDNLDLLYSFLLSNETENQSTLNPILASYFSRILITLIIRKPNELLNYLKSCKTFKDDFLRHLDSAPITEVLCRLIADCGEQRSVAIKWYEDINLFDDLIQQLLITNSTYVQMNIVNLLGEFLRLALDQQNGVDNNTEGNTSAPLSPSTDETTFSNTSETNQGSSSTNDNGTDEKFTPSILVQHILSKSNLEKLFDALCKQPKLVANGCDFLVTVLEMFGRHLPAPICLSLVSNLEEKSTSNDELSSENKDETERMQINDEVEALPVIKSNEKSTNSNSSTNLPLYAKNLLVRIYVIFLEVMSSRLPTLIALLYNPSAPLVPSLSSSPFYDSSQPLKYKFLNEPLGTIRLNLIKFFSKLIHTVSSDYTGDYIYQILDSNNFFYILMNLFYHHIHNNFLHTQVDLIIRHIFHINALAVKQPHDIWTRTPLPNRTLGAEISNLETFHYTKRCSYKLFQTILTSSEINLIKRLLDQYELNIMSSRSALKKSSSNDATDSSLFHTRFAAPNLGHVAQILRCLCDHSSTFNDYLSFIKADDNTSVFESHWEKVLHHLNENEKKRSAMHHNECSSANNFPISVAENVATLTDNATKLNNSSEANKFRVAPHKRSFGSSGPPLVDDDDDDDDEVERFNIDDELMNNEQWASERKPTEMRKATVESCFLPVFDEQSPWHQQNNTDMSKARNDNETKNNMNTTVSFSGTDLFENYQQGKSTSSTESNFEQLCSLRGNDHGGNSFNSPFQSLPSSTISDSVNEKQDKL